jgi:hypothetical protein
MRAVKNRLAPAPGQAKGRVVSKSRWSAGKRKANGVVKRTLRLANAVKKSAAHRSRPGVALRAIGWSMVWQENAMRVVRVKCIRLDANGATRGLGSPPYGHDCACSAGGLDAEPFFSVGQAAGMPCLAANPAAKSWPGTGFPQKTRFLTLRLWTSHCISTGPDVQNDVY